MVYSPIMGAFQLRPEEASGQPDYQKALQDVFKNVQGAYDTAYKPKNMAEALLAAQIQNKINQPKADDAQGWYNLQKEALQSETGLRGAHLKQALMDLHQNEWLNNALNGGSTSAMPSETQSTSMPSIPPEAPTNAGRNVSYEGPGPNYGVPTARNTFPGRFPASQQAPSLRENVAQGMGGAAMPAAEALQEAKVLTEGNPSLAHVDKLYDENPYARLALEKKGFKKTQTVKVDPRTGLSSVVTTYPSGKVEVRSTSNATGDVPLTNALKTLHQNIISGAPKAEKMIDDLIESPSPLGIPGFKPDQQARHKALVNAAAETYAKAKGWPNTNESIHRATTILGRGTLESDAAYRERLKSLKSSLKNDIKDSKNILNPSSKRQEQSSSNELTFNPETGRLE